VPFVVGDKKPSKHWEHLGWNPIQTGDEHNNPSKLLEHKNDEKTLYVRCTPMQWPLDNEPGECTFECWVTLDGPAARVRCRLNNNRSDKTQYPARGQEMPAVYTNGPYYRLMTYVGGKPFTDDGLTRIEKKRGEPGPWSSWLSTENWAALVNDDGWGLGVWNPNCYQYIGGFAGKPGAGGPKDDPTGYVAPTRAEILDHNVRHEYEYTLILGKLDAIRDYVVKHAEKPTPPAYRFKADRRGWSYVNATDAGWPIEGELNVTLDKEDPQLVGPSGFWPAADAPTLFVEAAFTTAQTTARVFWATHEEPFFTEKKSVSFPVKGDGQLRTYEVKLADSEHYRGAVVGLRLDPVAAGQKGDRVRIKSISFTKP
jgi:hypothetical protein